jgi:hypothetical protein
MAVPLTLQTSKRIDYRMDEVTAASTIVTKNQNGCQMMFIFVIR